MVSSVIKRDGREVRFKTARIVRAISKAGFVPKEIKEKIAEEIHEKDVDKLSVEEIQDLVEEGLMDSSYKEVAKEYVRYRYKRELLRGHKSSLNSILDIVSNKDTEDVRDVEEENSNKNALILSTQRDYMAGESSKELTMDLLLPDDIVTAHKLGLLHFHDADYFAQKEHNCALINIADMLQNGTVINGTLIEKPHSFSTACNVKTQIMAQVASGQYGGQSESLSDLAPFVDISRSAIRKEVLEELESVKEKYSPIEFYEYVEKVVKSRLDKEINKGVQIIQYQINTLMTCNGQTPFVTIFMYLNEVPEGQLRDDLALIIEEVVRQRYQGVKNEKGMWVTPSFPKLIYVLQEDNIVPGSKYWELTKLCVKCAAKRMVPDYVSEKIMLENKVDKNGDGHCYPPMGCRSFLSPYVDETIIDGEDAENLWNKLISDGFSADKDNRIYPPKGTTIRHEIINRTIKDCVVKYLEKDHDGVKAYTSTPVYYGRFNKGVVTVSLPDVSLSALKEFYGDDFKDIMIENREKDFDELRKVFFRIFDERLELCHRALQIRHQRLEGTVSDVSPIHWQHGGLARLKKGETIDRLLYGGYSTLSLGYAGLYECVYALTGRSHTDEKSKPFALEIMKYMNKKCDDWNSVENKGYSLYGTPIESTTYKFAKCLRDRFGVIKDITDYDYITNSYHVNVREHIDPIKKLGFEAVFQKLSPGGAISYIECSNQTNNPKAMLDVLRFMYESIMYSEFNTKSDACHICGYEGEISIVEDETSGRLIWKCPNCGNTDQKKMNVTRRTCGYLGSQFWNQGRTQEIRDRFVHLGGNL